MTREEAIKVIRKMLAYTDLSVRANLTADMVDACHLAIKILEQEPTTKNNLGVDCIDRQATLDAIIKRLGIKNETYLLEAERTIYQQILAMPPVTPQEPILNKIRAEIENDWQLKKYPSSPFSCGLRRAIEIIDKHMESKENENIN